MAYFSQEQKRAIAPKVAAILKRYGAKGSLSVRHYSTVVLTISSSPFAVDDHEDVNVHWIDRYYRDRPHLLAFLDELYAVMNAGNHDNSDPQFDHFDVGWYVQIAFGRWNRPHVCTAAEVAA